MVKSPHGQMSLLEYLKAPLLFLIYKNDLSEGLSTNAKLFADGTYLLPVIHDSQTSAYVVNKDLEMIHNWVFQWKKNFSSEPAKQAQKFIFSRKTKNYLILLYYLIRHILLNQYTKSTKAYY